ncbi:crotonobetaine/carnitine-CoA ligase [Escherichia coli]|nr:crotonobetaine/carnitine-CoA ligase [Escherichia coli]
MQWISLADNIYVKCGTILRTVYGHKTALICESSGGVVNRYSYLELNQEINRTANLFYTLGIRKGDKVALHLDNCPEFIFCWFGLGKNWRDYGAD